jgi:tryptophan synthase alpha chain
MNRLTTLFRTKPSHVLSIYCTAGFPNLHDTVPVLKALQRSGVDMIEIGIPFSDPIADGQTIQASSQQALQNGMTLELLFEQLREVRCGAHEPLTVPLVAMGYVNPILQFGVARFCQLCASVGIDGVIIPDLPVEVYERDFARFFAEYSVYNVLLVTPQTPDERIHRIDAASQGFLYAVSSAGTTGQVLYVDEEREAYFRRLQLLNLRNPVMIGFGITNKASFDAACRYAHGAIVGSAFIAAIAKSTNIEADVECFVAGFR